MPRSVSHGSSQGPGSKWYDLAFWLLLSWIGLTATASEASAGSTDKQGYVGSAVCQACLAGQFEAWTGSHHDLAMQPADASTVLGDFTDRVFEQSGMRKRFYRKGERFLVETQDEKGRNREYEIS